MGGDGMKQVDVRFESGREVLNAYWGYLSDGGLVIQRGSSLDVGQPIALEVRVTSSNSRYSFTGRVVKHRDDGRTVVAFHPGEPHDMLLTEALAETDHVPPRRHRRYVVDADGQMIVDDRGEPVRMINVSASGCCLQVSNNENAGVGTHIEVQAAGFCATGTVVWSRHTERGVRFDSDREADVKALLGLSESD